MARIYLMVALVALCATVALAAKDPPKDAKFVTATISIDNNPADVKKQQAVIEKELATRICKFGKPVFVSIKDTAGGLNGNDQTQLVFQCPGKTPAELEEIMDDCTDSTTNVRQLKDEVEDATNPDIEIESIKCEYGPTPGAAGIPATATAAAATAGAAVTGAAATAGSAVTGAADTATSAVTGAAEAVGVKSGSSSLRVAAAGALLAPALVLAML